MKANRFWIIIIVGLLLVFGGLSALLYMNHGAGNVVGIYQDGKQVDRIHLDTVTTPYEFTIETEAGGYNVISVEQGRICVKEASCPDHVCVETGWLSDGAIPIVCLPNRLVIQSERSDGVDIAAQ